MAQDIFSNFELHRAEVDQQSMLEPRRFEVAQHLGNMLIHQRAASFHFDDEPIIDYQVGRVSAEGCAILVVNGEGHLLFDCQAEFTQAVAERILIHPLKMAVAVIDVNGISRLPDVVAQSHDVFHRLT